MGGGLEGREERKEGKTEDGPVTSCLQPSAETLWCLVLRQTLVLELGEALPASPGSSIVGSMKPCGNQFKHSASSSPTRLLPDANGKLNQETSGGGGVEAGRNWEK